MLNKNFRIFCSCFPYLKFLRNGSVLNTLIRQEKGPVKNTPIERTKETSVEEIRTRTVMFVTQTPRGELAARLRSVLRGLEHICKFRVKVVERTGRTLRSHFPLTRLWEGLECGREDCVTCHQGLEDLPPCTRSSVVYENICAVCNPGARTKGELKSYSPGDPIHLHRGV